MFFWKDQTNSQSVVSSIGVNGSTSSCIYHFDGMKDQILVQSISQDMEYANNDQIFGSNSPDNSSEGDKHRADTIWTCDESDDIEGHCFLSPLVVEEFVPKLEEEEVKLSHKGIDEKSVGEGAPGITPDKCHQKAKSDQHHHIYVLEGRISLRGYAVVNGRVRVDHHEDPIERNHDGLEDNDQDSWGVERVFLLLVGFVGLLLRYGWQDLGERLTGGHIFL